MTKRLTQKEFKEVWHPTIQITEVSNDPYVYKAVGTVNYYGVEKQAREFGGHPKEAALKCLKNLMDQIW